MLIPTILLPVRDSPESGCVARDGGQQRAVGAKCDALDDPTLVREQELPRAAAAVPDANRLIRAARSDMPAIGAPRQAKHRAPVFSQRQQL